MLKKTGCIDPVRELTLHSSWTDTLPTTSINNLHLVTVTGQY